MKISVTRAVFGKEFEDLGRAESWSREGLDVLFEHLDNTRGENEELDVGAIDSQFAEYPSARKACDDIGIKYSICYRDDDDEVEDEEDTESGALRRLKRRMQTVLELKSGGVIVEE